MADTFYAVVQWTSAKVTSMGIISEDEVSEGKFEVGAKIEALHRNIAYAAKILFIGELDLMMTKLESLRNTYKAPSSDSPRGRGHRVIKKKVMEDFVEDSSALKAACISSDSSKESGEIKASSKAQNQLKRKAAELTGDAIIKKLLCQRDVDDIELSEVEERSDDAVVTDRFEEAHLIASLRSQLNDAHSTIKQLQEDIEELKQQNYLLQKKLPDLVAEVKNALISSKTARSPLRQIQVDATPVQCSPSRKPDHMRHCKTPERKSPLTSLGRETSSKENSSQDELSPTSNQKTDFVISNEIIRQASTAKTWGSLACNLMTALFSREEMAISCLTEKQAAKTGKAALPVEKVKAITDQVKKMFPSTETAAIRIKLSTKLRDERIAFNSN